MPETLPVADEHRLVEIDVVQSITRLSKPTIHRHHGELLPAGCKIGRSLRWRLRTGDPKTGLLDWLEAGCPPVRSDSSASETEA